MFTLTGGEVEWVQEGLQANQAKTADKKDRMFANQSQQLLMH